MSSDSVMIAAKLPTFVLSMAWRSYLRRLQADPLLTKSITAAVLSVVSDICAKRVSKLPLKSSTAINELTIGLILRGPVIHYFHTFLDKVVFRALYFVLRGLTEDRGLATTSKKLRRELWGIMCSSWAVWVPANFVSYLAIPLELRVLFGNVVGLFWNAFLIAKVSRN